MNNYTILFHKTYVHSCLHYWCTKCLKHVEFAHATMSQISAASASQDTSCDVNTVLAFKIQDS
jgi:hypothetical protein